MEYKIRNFPDKIRREEQYLARHPDDVQAREQSRYYRDVVAAVKWLASLVRTERTTQRRE